MRRSTAKLILVDGFAGTGKSTTAQRLWLDLVTAGSGAVWFHEHEVAHPIFEYGEVEELLHWTPERLEQRLLAGWKACAAADDGRVRIIEGSFFQIPIAVMLAMNVPPARIRAFIRRVDAIVASRDAALIYLFRPDLKDAFAQLGDIRGVQWLEGIAAALQKSPYGRTHRVRNVDGVIEYYRRQQVLIDSVFPRLLVRRVALDVSGARWDHYQRKMRTFLGTPRTAPPLLSPADLLRHAGTYRGTKTRQQCRVMTDATTLYIQLPQTDLLRMIHVEDEHFCLEGLPIDVHFAYDPHRRAARFDYLSRMVTEVRSDSSWVRA
jgi:hypothetical protein